MVNGYSNTKSTDCGGKIMRVCSRVKELKSLDSLNLPKKLYNIIKDLPPEELIYKVRAHKKNQRHRREAF